LAIDKDSGLEQHFYLDDEVNLERLSHPVSGQEYLVIHYHRSIIQSFQRWLAHQLLKLHIDPLKSINNPRESIKKHAGLILFFILALLIIIIGGYMLFVVKIASGAPKWLIGLAAGASISFTIIAFMFRQIPIIPHTMNQTLTQYDGHNIDNLVNTESSKWLNSAVYDHAWPEYNQRTTDRKNNQNEHLMKIDMSKENLTHLGIEPSVEHFLKMYVDDDVFDSISPQPTTKVQRALILIWILNPPRKTSISGKLNEKFNELAKRKLSEDIYNYILSVEDESVSPTTRKKFLSEYGDQNTVFNPEKSDSLIEVLSVAYHDAGPPLRIIFKTMGVHQ
jgi:hypothetical protein